MRIAITGGTGFVGRHLAARLDPADTVVVSRRTGVDIDDVDALAAAFAGCDVVVHAAGINREIGDQTFQRVHVEGTRAMIEAARRAGVKRIVMVSFLRARPDCGSGYHETKWAAEELIRHSGIDHTILKASMIYGSGDHMVDHVTRAVRTWPVFGTVGFRERTVRPIPVADFVDVMVAAAEGRIPDPTVAVMGAEELALGAAVRRVAHVAGKRPLFVALAGLGDPRARAGHRVDDDRPAGGEGPGADARRGRERGRAAGAGDSYRHPAVASLQRREHPRRAADGGPFRVERPAGRPVVEGAHGVTQGALTFSSSLAS